MLLLKVEELCVSYGNIEALRNVSFELNRGEMLALIGSNGAGKSTALRTISGLVKPRSGCVTFYPPGGATTADGQGAGIRLDQMASHRIVRQGLVQVPEGRQVFPSMTVRENLEMGAFTVKSRLEQKERTDEVAALFPRLAERANQMAGTLSGGEQQMLAIGRALVAKPVVIMFDEPSLGLAPQLVDSVLDAIRAIKDRGITVLLVEQNAHAALSLADRGYVLEAGEMRLSGTGKELLENEEVKRVYLGY